MKAYRTILSFVIFCLVCIVPLACGNDSSDEPQADHPGGNHKNRNQVCPQPGTETIHPDNLTRLALSARIWKREGTSYYRICRIAGNNLEPVWLTPEGKNCCNPVWAPYGEKIAFFTKDGNGTIRDVGVVNSDGRGLMEELTRADGYEEGTNTGPISDRLLTWSPDGTKIIYAIEEDGGNVLSVFSIDPRTLHRRPLKRISRNNPLQYGEEGRPHSINVNPWNRLSSISPDGRCVVEIFGQRQIFRITGPGRSDKKNISMPEGPPSFSLCDWAPDSKRLLVQFDPPGANPHPEIFILDTVRAELTRLCDGRDGRWSCAGAGVIYISLQVDTSFGVITGGRERDLVLKCNSLCIIPASGGEGRRLLPGRMLLDGCSVTYEYSPEAVVDFGAMELLPSASAVFLPEQDNPEPDPGLAPDSTLHIEEEVHFPQTAPPPGGIAFEKLGEFVSESGFTAFSKDGRNDIIVASEISANKYTVSKFTLRGGGYALVERKETPVAGEENKYRKKFSLESMKALTFKRAKEILPPHIAAKAAVLWAGQEGAGDSGGARTWICYVISQENSSWQAVVSIYTNARESQSGGYEEISKVVALEGTDAAPRNANAMLTDLNGDGERELVLALTTTIDEGWREDLKIFSLSSE